MADKCPFCGAGSKDFRGYYACATHEKQGERAMLYLQSTGCKDRQIDQLQASRDRWKGLFEAYSEYGMGTYFTTDGEAAVKQAIAALKEAGEWEE